MFQCAGSTRKKKVINKGLVIPGQESQLIGKRKGDHEVFHRQELLLLAIEPKGSLMILALRAVAVAAGTGLACGVTAFCALNEYLTACGVRHRLIAAMACRWPGKSREPYLSRKAS